jgi:hypothetical protein
MPLSKDQFESIIDYIAEHQDYREKLLDALKPDILVDRNEFREALDEIKQLRVDFNTRFEEQTKTFNTRFEEQTKTFNTRFEEQTKTFNTRFEEHSNEIKQLRIDFNTRFEEQNKLYDQKFEKLISEMNKGFEFMKSELNEFSGKYGYLRENEIRRFLREFLSAQGISVDKIKHHQIIDEKGIVFREGYITEIDLYYEHQDGVWAIEIKASVDERDVFHFNKVCDLLTKRYKKTILKKIITCHQIDEKAENDSKHSNIEIWLASKEDPILVYPDS